MWTHQNKVSHEKQDCEASKKKQEMLNNCIDEEFENGIVGLRKQDQDFMDITPEKVKKWNVSQQGQWLEGINIIREKQQTIKDKVEKKSEKYFVTKKISKYKDYYYNAKTRTPPGEMAKRHRNPK